jgi:hypothetical protein
MSFDYNFCKLGRRFDLSHMMCEDGTQFGIVVGPLSRNR